MRRTCQAGRAAKSSETSFLIRAHNSGRKSASSCPEAPLCDAFAHVLGFARVPRQNAVEFGIHANRPAAAALWRACWDGNSLRENQCGVIALSKNRALAQAKQKTFGGAGPKQDASAAELWISYRLSRRAWLASRCFVRLRILLMRLDICPPFSCVANIGAVYALNSTASAGENVSPAAACRLRWPDAAVLPRRW